MHGPGAEAGGEKTRVCEVEGEEEVGLEREMLGRGERRVVQARRGRVAARVRVGRRRRVGRCIVRVVWLCGCV